MSEPREMSIRVFISHSTWPKPDLDRRLQDEVRAHAAFRKRLCERLAEAGIESLVDEQIPAGRFWRDFLFERIADCRAAIVLVNEQALFHSPWVDTEVKVLGYRAHHEKQEGFCLIAVPIKDISGTDIVSHRAWEPIALGELQMLPRQSLDVSDDAEAEAVINQIIETLKRLPGADRSKSGWLVDRLCALLQAQRGSLRDLGESLGVETSGLDDDSRVLRRRIAHALYREGPLAVLKLVNNPHSTLSKPVLRDILDIVKTYWIDLSASLGILCCCAKEDGQRVIAINGKEVGYTPRAYVRQVCGEQYSWPVIPLLSTYDPVGQIRDTLAGREYFGSILADMLCRDPEDAPEELVTQSLNTLLSGPYAAPVFVAFLQEQGGEVSDLINEISAVFPKIRFIVCTGTEEGRAFVPGAYMLTPELRLEVEGKTMVEFNNARTHVPRGR